MRNVCEYILIEKMKKKEFLYCNLCQEVFFNYKQRFIHFVSINHFAKEMENDSLYVTGLRHLIDSFTDLPKTFLESDEKTEHNDDHSECIQPHWLGRPFWG
ncbi:hypothetical protein PENTCL1PPCAC_23852, partial [Pristionchus entomophagus]